MAANQPTADLIDDSEPYRCEVCGAYCSSVGVCDVCLMIHDDIDLY
jgi:hypothetical protein